MTWWGHASATVTIGGVRVLTDPVLTARVAHLYRPVAPTPPRLAAEAEIVIVSHLHVDHLHLPSLRRLPRRARVIVPRGTVGLLRRQAPDLAARVEEVVPGDAVRIGEVEISVSAANHDGRRLPGSRHHGPALGFVLRAGGESVWFAGDTGLFDEMSSLGPVDVALVPVGGWGPTLGRYHLHPEQAAEAVRRVGAEDAVPVHYGTLWPTGLRQLAPATFRHRCLEPGARFAQALAGTARAHVLLPGSSVDLEGLREPGVSRP